MPTPLDRQTLEDLARTALEAAEAAAAVHRHFLGQVGTSQARDKGIFDFVSEVDLKAQAEALRVLRERSPAFGILAEEDDPSAPEREIRAGVPLWIVDPLDGTTNFLHGHPAFCASVGLVVEGRPMVGAVVAPALGERYWGAVGLGGWCQLQGGAPAPLRVSSISTLREALVGTGFPFKRPEELPQYLRELGAVLPRSSGVRREGAAALDLCRLARGSLDAFWEGRLEPWDVAGGLALLHAAGGVWAGAEGAAYPVVDGGPLRAANAPGLLEELEQVLALASL